jgi:indolepyruvate ferredoxin oxidoreductase alpha subunit
VYGAPGPVSKHEWLKEVFPRAQEIVNRSPYNTLELQKGAKVGIIASGLAASYTKEALARLGMKDKVSFLKLGMIHPLPEQKVGQLLAEVESVICIEEGDPVVESVVRSYAKEHACGVKIYGKSYNQVLEPVGEINTDKVADAIAGVMKVKVDADKREKTREKVREIVAPRSSTLCAGCSHLGSYWALKKALKEFDGVHIVNGDIGCYEQGGYGLFASKLDVSDEASKKHPVRSPYEILDTIYVMGSGIGLAQGQAQAGYKDGKVVAVAGDSTLIHACLPAIVNAVYSKADITFLVLDNSWTAMTGHQVNPNTGVDTCGNKVEVFDMESSIKAMGVKSLHTARAYNLEQAQAAIKEALDYTGPSVVILRGECMLQVLRRTKKGEALTYVDEEVCIGCKQCLQLGCPAIMFDTEKKKAGIDKINCTDCDLCVQVCPYDAIKVEGR